MFKEGSRKVGMALIGFFTLLSVLTLLNWRGTLDSGDFIKALQWPVYVLVGIGGLGNIGEWIGKGLGAKNGQK